MTIKEVRDSASQKQRGELLTLIVLDGVSYPTAYAWCNGNRKPKPLYQERISRYVKEVAGVTATAEELFPEKEG